MLEVEEWGRKHGVQFEPAKYVLALINGYNISALQCLQTGYRFGEQQGMRRLNWCIQFPFDNDKDGDLVITWNECPGESPQLYK